jgi:hypothetical protein
MSSESMCHVARSWVVVGSFHMRLVVRFKISTASDRNIFGFTVVYSIYTVTILCSIYTFVWAGTAQSV